MPIAACANNVTFTDQVAFANDGGVLNASTRQGVRSFSELPPVGTQGPEGLGNPSEAAPYPCSSCLGMASFNAGQMNPLGVSTSAVNWPGAFSPIQGAGSPFKIDGPGGMVFTGRFSRSGWNKIVPGTLQFNSVIMNAKLTIGGTTYDIPRATEIQLTRGGTGEAQNLESLASSLGNHGIMGFLASMPEPGALTLLGTGLIVIGIFVRRVAS